MTTPLTYSRTLPSDIFVSSALSASVSVCLSVGTCVDDDGERLRYGVLSLCLSAGEQRRGDGVPLSVARRSRSPGGRSLLSTCLRTGLESAAAGGDRAVCLPPAAESLVLRVATQLPALGSAAPQLRAPRAPRRHALAPRAMLQRLARAERRAATSDPGASQATRRQPVSCFRSTQVRTVRQISKIARLATKRLW